MSVILVPICRYHCCNAVVCRHWVRQTAADHTVSVHAVLSCHTFQLLHFSFVHDRDRTVLLALEAGMAAALHSSCTEVPALIPSNKKLR